MIKLPTNDRRRVALLSAKPVILSLVEVHFTDGVVFYHSGANYITISRYGASVSYTPHVLQSISDIVHTAQLQRNEVSIGLVDKDFKTPSLSLYTKIQKAGAIGLPVKVGVFFRDGAASNPYTLPLFDFVGQTDKVSRRTSLIKLTCVSFLSNIDDYQMRLLTKNSQRAADSTDSALDFVETATSKVFGGVSRD